MACRRPHRAPFQVSRVQWCAIAITSGEDLQPDGILTVDIPGIENLLRCALNSSVAMDYLPADSRFAGTGFAEEVGWAAPSVWLPLMRIGERSLVTSPDRERTSPVELGRIETFEAWTPAVTA
jgi:hypothetical protein